jgi:hypothetical protein
MASGKPETCLPGARGLSAPIFAFGGSLQLPTDDAHVRNASCQALSGVSFVLSGPGATAEAGHLPVRGDLAHINLAGRYFVPHYAVPMPHTVISGGAPLRAAGRDDADTIVVLTGGCVFNVLDMAGGWAWGQIGEDGFVGYLPLAVLAATKQ